MTGPRILVTGGARSGKSRHAQALAEALCPQRVYLATAQAGDEEMAARIARHQAERGPGWRTVEEPLWPERHLSAHGEVVLLDCLTLWLSNWFLREERAEERRAAAERLVQAVRACPGPLVIVTNEVGLGIVPSTPLGRAFRDEAGFLAQAMARVCDRVILTVAGLPLIIKDEVR